MQSLANCQFMHELKTDIRNILLFNRFTNKG